MNYETIQIQKASDRIGIITLNRPEKRNALSIKMRNEISSCLNEWAASDAIGVVIFTGAGSAFSAGFDLKEFKQQDLFDDILKSSSSYHRIVWNFPKPLIAAINGPALGGGFDLSTLCNIRISSQSALFGHPEIKFGAPPLFTPLRWIIGSGLASDLCLTGRRIDSTEAHRIGLVSEVVENDEVVNRAIQIGDSILEAPIETLKITKKYIIGNTDKDFEESFCIEHDEVFDRNDDFNV
jgi:enoyl-CoA hydratase/carnithine racemase